MHLELMLSSCRDPNVGCLNHGFRKCTIKSVAPSCIEPNDDAKSMLPALKLCSTMASHPTRLPRTFVCPNTPIICPRCMLMQQLTSSQPNLSPRALIPVVNMTTTIFNNTQKTHISNEKEKHSDLSGSPNFGLCPPSRYQCYLIIIQWRLYNFIVSRFIVIEKKINN
jgi:hypothetical protein